MNQIAFFKIFYDTRSELNT